MKYQIVKMDGRYNRHGYTYLIQFAKNGTYGTGVLDFDRSRRWFNATFGWSQDVETREQMQVNQRHRPEAYDSTDINAAWAYCVKYGDYRIYVANDQILGWFMLCHPAS